MKRFKIIFRTFVYDKNSQVLEGKRLIRVIAARDRKTAERIARAMEGEGLGGQSYIWDPILIEETGEDYEMASFDSQETWDRALEKMGLDRKDVNWVNSDKDPNEFVGIDIK